MMDQHSNHKHEMSLAERIKRLGALSSTEISDALDACRIEGALLAIKPLSSGMKLIGPAYTIAYKPYEKPPATFQGAANYIEAVPTGSVIVIDNQGHVDCTVWGHILTYAAYKKGIAGTVVHGAVRDVAAIHSLPYPLYASGYCMRSGKNRVQKIAEKCPLTINGIVVCQGDMMFGDDNGVLVIPAHLVDDIIIKAENIRRTEENILLAIKNGVSLEQARLDFHYSEPWLEQKQP